MSKQNKRIGFRIVREIRRVEQEILDQLKELDTTLLSDGANSRVAMEWGIRPIIPGSRIIGQAITLKLTLGDSLLVSMAMEIAQPGDVVVIDGAGTENNALWGDMKSLIGKEKGLGGAVIDGAIRDVVNCREIGFPVFCKYCVCGSSTKNSPGEINVPINCGKMVVNPGDIIVGDDNGIVVLPPYELKEIINNARKKEKLAAEMRQEILNGKYVTDGFVEKMKALGYEL